MKGEDKCSTQRCRGDVFLELIDKPLCERCWEKHCDEVVEENERRT